MACCQLGMATVVLMPPLLPFVPTPLLYQFQVVSPVQVPPGPLVLSVVPPTTVMLALSAG